MSGSGDAARVSVSVVILVLNRAPLLTRALASAARQRELMPLETIVVDVELATGISLLKQAVVEGGCRIHHLGGIVIHDRAEIGERCTLRQGVTIGDRENGGTDWCK